MSESYKNEFGKVLDNNKTSMCGVLRPRINSNTYCSFCPAQGRELFYIYVRVWERRWMGIDRTSSRPRPLSCHSRSLVHGIFLSHCFLSILFQHSESSMDSRFLSVSVTKHKIVTGFSPPNDRLTAPSAGRGEL